MYKNNQNNIIFSPSDLTVFMDSPFASWMERLCIESPDFAIQPDNDDELISVLAEKGIVHETDFMDYFRSKGLSILDIGEAPKNNQYQATLEAMKRQFGIPGFIGIITQLTFYWGFNQKIRIAFKG